MPGPTASSKFARESCAPRTKRRLRWPDGFRLARDPCPRCGAWPAVRVGAREALHLQRHPLPEWFRLSVECRARGCGHRYRSRVRDFRAP